MAQLKRYNGTSWETVGGVVTGDTLPIGSEIEYNGSNAPAGWQEIADYSTSEIDTGKKWIDGKTIYRKVLNIGARTYTSGNNNIAHNISNIDKVISINFKVHAYSSWYEKWDNINNVIATSTNFNTHINNQFDADDGFAIIEYTKTS